MSAVNIEQLIAKANNQIAQAETVNKNARSAHVEKEWTPSRWCKRHHRGLPRMRAPRPRHRATHRRLSRHEVRQALEEDQFEDAVASQVEKYLYHEEQDAPRAPKPKNPKPSPLVGHRSGRKFPHHRRRVIVEAITASSNRREAVVCTCGHTTFTQSDKVRSVWAEHVREHTYHAPRARRLYVPFIDKCKAERRRLIKAMRRQQRAVESKGLLAQLRYTMNGQIPAMQMANFFRVTNHTTWDNSTEADWSATTGGAGGVGVPGAGDTAIFDANTPVVTITTNYNPSITAITLDVGFTGTLTLGAACTLTGSFTHTQGTFTTSNNSCTWLAYGSSGTLARTLTTGSSSIAVSATTSPPPVSISSQTNLTITTNTTVWTLSGAGCTFNIPSGLNMQGGSITFTGSGTKVLVGTGYTNITVTGTANKTDILSVFNSFSVSGTVTVTSNSSINRVLVQSSTLGAARTITAATVVITGIVDFQDITGAGAATWTVAGSGATALGDAGGNTGITFTPSATQTWSGTSGGNWSANAWTSRVPLPQDGVVINAAFIASQTVTSDMPRLGRSIDWTGVTGAVKWTTGSTTVAIFGNITLAAGMIFLNGSSSWSWNGRGAQTVTSVGNSWGNFVTQFSPGGTYTLQDAASFGSSFSLANGTFTTNNQAVTVTNIFESDSGGTRVINLGSSAVTLARSTAGNCVQITASGTLNVGTATFTATGAPGSATTVTTSTGGVTMPNFTVNGGANLTVQFSDAFTTAGTVTLTAGALDFNSKNVTASIVNVGNNAVRTLTMGSSAVAVSSSVGAWTSSASTNLTVTANTAIITATGNSSTSISVAQINWQGASFVIQPSSLGPLLNFGNGTIANLTLTGLAIKTMTVSFSAGVIVTGTFASNGNSTVNRTLINSTTLGTARTITVNTTVTSINTDWQDMTAAGTASWDLSAATGGSGDALGNTGITFTPAATQFWFSGTGNWSDSTKWFLATAGGGGAGRVPLPQDNVRFDASSFTAGSQTVTADMPRLAFSVDFTGTTNTPGFALSGSNPSIFGNLTLVSGMTRGSSPTTFVFGGRGSQTITFGGFSGFHGVSIAAFGGTYTLQDALSIVTTTNLSIANGTFAANNQNVTSGRFDLSTSSATRAVTMGSGAWTLGIATATSVWQSVSTGLTLTISTAVVSCTGAPGSAITVTVGTSSVSMPSFTVNGGANLTVQFSDAFTTTGTVTLTAGKLDTNGQTCSWGIWSGSGSTTRTLSLGSSSVTITTGAGNGWNNSTATSMTLTANTSTITLSGADANFGGGGLTTYNNVVITSAGTPVIASSFTTVNFTRTGTAVKTDKLSFAAGATSNVITGTFTITGNSTTNRMFVQSATLGTARTITCNGVCAHSNVDWQDITAAGTGAPFTGTSMGDALGNTNITFDAPVTRYGVVAGNWSSTATWSNASGGAGGFSVPLPQDTVILDASSGAGTYTADMPRLGANLTMTGFTRTLTFNTASSLFGNLTWPSGGTLTQSGSSLTLAGRGSQTITTNAKTSPMNVFVKTFGGTYTLQDAYLSGGTSGFEVQQGTFLSANFNMSFSYFNTSQVVARAINFGSSSLTIQSNGGGGFTLGNTALTWTIPTGTLTYTGTSGTNVITTAGQSMPNLTVNGAGVTIQFSDTFTTLGTINVGAGTLDTNSKAVTCSVFASNNGGTRTVTFGSSAITCTATGATGWSCSNTSGIVVTANTAIVTLNGAGVTFNSGAVNWNGLSVVLSGSGIAAIAAGGDFTVANLTRTGTAVKTDSMTVAVNPTITGQASFNGNSVTNRLLVQSNTLGTARTITVNGTRSHSNVDFMDIAGAGTASTDLSAITGGSGDCGGNSGYTFTPAQTNFYQTAVSDNWSTTAKWFLASNGAGGAGRVPLPQDTARFDANSVTAAGKTITLDMPRSAKDMDYTGVANSPAWFASISTTIFGSFTGTTTMTRSSSSINSLTFQGRGTHTITSPSGFNFPITGINGPGGTVTLQNTYTNNGNGLSVSFGTFDANNQTVLTGAFTSAGTSTRVVTVGTGAWSITQTTTGTIWNVVATGLTLNAGSSIINYSTASAASRSFAGGGLTYGTLSYTVAASTGPLVITGANTFANLTVTSEAGNAKTLTLPSATNTTITSTLSLNGVASDHLILNASTATSQATITAGAGVTIDVHFVDITDSNAVGGARFQDHDGVGVANDTGWLFVTVVSDTVSLAWNTRITAADTVALAWAVRKQANDQVGLVWTTRSHATDSAVLRWNTRIVTNDQISIRWNTRIVASDTVTARWATHALAAKMSALRWGVRLLTSDAVALSWRTRAPASDSVFLHWGTLRGLPLPKATATSRLTSEALAEDE